MPAVTEPVAILKTTQNAAAARAFVDFILSDEGQKLAVAMGYIPAKAERRDAGVAIRPGSKINLMPTDIRQGRADEQRQPEALRRALRQLTRTRSLPHPRAPRHYMANASGARGRFEDYALLWGLIGVVALLVGAAARAAAAGGRRAGRRVLGDALRRVLSSSRPGRRRGTASSPRSAARALAVVLGGVVALVGVAHRHPRPQRVRLLLRAAADAGAAGRGAGVAADVRPVEPAAQDARARAGAGQPQSAVLARRASSCVLGVQYAPLVFLTLRAGLRTLPQELIEAALAGGARPLRVIAHHRAAADDAAARSRASRSASSPASATSASRRSSASRATISCCRRSSTSASPDSGPACCPRSRCSRADRRDRARRASSLQDVHAAPARLPHRPRRRSRRAPFELRRWRLPVEIALWTLVVRRAGAAAHGALLTSLVPAVGVPLNAASATLENYRFVLFEHAAARRAFGNSFGLSAAAAIVDRADRGAARLFPRLAPLAAAARREPRDRSALRAARRRARDRGDPPVPEAAAGARRSRSTTRSGSSSSATSRASSCSACARSSAAITSSTARSRKPRRSPARGCCGGCARSSFRWSRRPRPRARCSSSSPRSTSSRCRRCSGRPGAETLGVVFFSFQQGGDSTYAAALGTLTVIVSIALMLSTLLLAAQACRKGVLPWRD